MLVMIVGREQLSEDLNRALKEQHDSKAPADADQDPAALNAKLIHDCELMAREIEMLEAELEKQKARPAADVSPRLEQEPDPAANTEALLKDLQDLDEDNRSGQPVCAVHLRVVVLSCWERATGVVCVGASGFTQELESEFARCAYACVHKQASVSGQPASCNG